LTVSPPATPVFSDPGGQLDRAGQELERQLANSANYCRLLDSISAQLAALNLPIALPLLRPIVATIERHLSAPLVQIDLDDFKRLTNSLYRFWVMSGRDLALQPLCEVVARRFGFIVSALKQPVAAVDLWFDSAFTMVFKSAADWHQTMAWLNPEVINPYFRYLERVYPATPRAALPAGAHQRIGYLVWSPEIAGSFAIGRILYSIMRGHAELDPRTEIFIYDRSGCSPASDAAFKALPNVTLRHLRGFSLDEISATITADAPNSLIMEGFNSASFRLMQRRLAARQFYMPCGMHPMTAPFFDGYLMYENLAQNAFALGVPRERSAILPWTLDRQFLDPIRSATEIERVRPTLPVGRPLFATFCRMEKATQPFLLAMADLLTAIPEAGLLLAGPNDQARIAGFFAARGLGDRVAMPGNVDPHVYHPHVDVFVDTFPMCGGLAPVEAMAKGVPAVFLADSGTESSRDLRDPALSAATPEEYVALAIRLAREPDFLAARQAAARAIADRTTSVIDTTRAILQHINRLPAAIAG
jgi:hypothetical protein